jgi:glycosyltransferase involved in cell wall biosynthesis
MKISVVMGVHDADPLELQATLDSILGQTFRDFELIVVDDGSHQPISVADPRARVIRLEQNRGLTRALIEGCAAVRGEYIARHDAGDLSAPTRFAKQAALLDANEEVAFTSSFTEYIGPRGEPLFIHRGRERPDRPLSILDPRHEHGVIDGPISHGSVMFRRSAYERAGGYRPQFYYGQDWDLWYRLAAVGKYQCVQEVLYWLRVTPDSISVTARTAQRAIARLSEEAMRARANGQSEKEILLRAAAIRKVPSKRLCARARGLYFIGEALRRNGDRRARSYLLRAALSCPFLLKPWLRLLQSLALR